MNKTQRQIIKKSTLLSLTVLAITNPVEAQETTIKNQQQPLIVAQNNSKTTITGIQINPRESGIEITIETDDGTRPVPLIMNESEQVIIDFVDTTLNINGDNQFQVNDISLDISNITLSTLDDNTVRIVVTGTQQTPFGEIVPSPDNLVLSLTTGQRNTAQNIFNQDDITITITGTRTARRLLDSANSITIIDSQQIERQLIQNIQDLVRYEPGVSVGRASNRFGNQDFNIRGIDGNRVLLQVDGIRVPDNFVGRGRDYFNLETTKRVEIIKGPASALYGSDAIGGVVSFITKDPQDYLDVFGNSFYTSGQIGYDSRDESISLTGVLAGEDEDGKLQFSTVFGFGSGSEFKTRGDAIANPQDTGDLSLTAKLVYNFNDHSSLKFTGEFLDEEVETNLLDEVGRTPFNLRPPNLVFFDRQLSEATDTRKRNRFSLDYNSTNPSPSWLDAINAKIYYQDAFIREQKISSGIQQSLGMGPPRFAPVTRDEINEFSQEVFGGEIQLQSDFQTARASHRLVYGLELFNTSTSRPRDNTLIFGDGTTSKFVIGEEFPNKTFPDTDTLRIGAYIQDEIEMGKWSIIPGLRWDYFSLNANEDDDFRRINVDNFEVENRNDSAFSPKIGVVYKATPELSLYGQYARGFRSPPYDDANIGFTNFAFQYAVLPNGDLSPETSDSFEIGVRGSYPQVDFSLAGFYNNYNNFIDNVALGDRPSDGFRQFQAQNIDSAEIYGVEARAEYFFNPTRQDGFSLVSSLAWTEGNNNSDGNSVPLNSIDPFQAVVGLRYRAPEDRWGSELVGTFVGAKTNADGDDLFLPNGYFLLDLIGYYNFSKNTSLNVGLFNLFDQKYFVWSDVRGTTVDNANLERFAPPGFNAGINFRLRF
ncbi:TonB-dependent hemoglobin/transferrin/lactoferrin family receptor [Cyanobacterium sp. IPPAS B-1200]|uniref:TonB-dependent hemoglobin/transferrin/lactoferrin family receptor n=1 Tax=Cyanobacterium sp. IPPAS B-1200 TaxID=1562720 RepID=UPI0008527AB5|nr:TonB-dependent hemoglobin/transferrin/lactoferrin family receptor [Cyanobacterium sp. IPPAS B-1200]OEJ79352.1 TonB-dependent receptor [Cyanobacterium sp. IPPAS B-1200]